MTLKSDALGWGSLAKLFHWSVVILLLVQGVLGLVMVELPKRPNVIPVFNFHKSLGLTILLLALLRLGWRLLDRHPQPPPGMPRWQVHGANAGHALLYGLLFAVPITGWAFDSATSLRPLFWWGLVQMPNLTGGASQTLKPIFQAAHEWLFFALVLVAAGHAAVALVHHFVNRDDVLRRMLPGRRAPSRSPTES
ncbi:MAG: cytochrome b [Dokdonella sp.]|uniref:cytochrome b n=1 Tax=Dokdonella sp. TaxID=2291710 RepID=UPI0025C2C838|nr:cytochrome b [Dokdonella sp.]MBX3701232.1 cytochrome b [Dokdonella sp.]MCW5577797.1 cytochrome b [Dokdonella sp.]